MPFPLSQRDLLQRDLVEHVDVLQNLLRARLQVVAIRMPERGQPVPFLLERAPIIGEQAFRFVKRHSQNGFCGGEMPIHGAEPIIVSCNMQVALYGAACDDVLIAIWHCYTRYALRT